MNYKDKLEAGLQSQLMTKPMFMGSYKEPELTVSERIRHYLSYLTRYRIVDTWHMHDDCE